MTTIEWTDNTFNPWVGCSKVSPACNNCYAEELVTNRMRLKVWGPASTTPRKRTSASNWKNPVAWNNRAKKTGKREKVFCASLADVFEDHPMLPEIRADLWKLIEQCSNLDWQLLTKRPENIMRMVPQSWHKNWPAHVWAGTTVENQATLEKRVPWLLGVPAPVRFLSCEPLLEAIDLDPPTCQHGHGHEFQTDFHEYTACMECGREMEYGTILDSYANAHNPGINWVIVGGESGNNARAFNLAWARNIVAQCRESSVPVFVKQMGDQSLDNGKPVNFGSKGKVFESWPAELQVREFPEGYVRATRADVQVLAPVPMGVQIVADCQGQTGTITDNVTTKNPAKTAPPTRIELVTDGLGNRKRRAK